MHRRIVERVPATRLAMADAARLPDLETCFRMLSQFSNQWDIFFHAMLRAIQQ